MIGEFRKEHVVKIMLQVAKRKRELTKLEKKYDKKIKNVDKNREEEIISLLTSKHWITQTPVFIPSQDTNQIVLPFLTSDGEGLSHSGEAKLNDLIDSLEEDRIKKRKYCISKILKYAFNTIIGILSVLVSTFLIYYFGWK